MSRKGDSLLSEYYFLSELIDIAPPLSSVLFIDVPVEGSKIPISLLQILLPLRHLSLSVRAVNDFHFSLSTVSFQFDHQCGTPNYPRSIPFSFSTKSVEVWVSDVGIRNSRSRI